MIVQELCSDYGPLRNCTQRQKVRLTTTKEKLSINYLTLFNEVFSKILTEDDRSDSHGLQIEQQQSFS